MAESLRVMSMWVFGGRCPAKHERFQPMENGERYFSKLVKRHAHATPLLEESVR